MPTTYLTKTSVERAQPRAVRYELLDSKLKNFGVRITPAGEKTFFVTYRVGDGGRTASKRRVTLGKFGQLTVEQARDAASSLLATAKLGADPATAKADRRAAVTVADLATRFLETHMDAKRKPSTAAQYREILNGVVVPAIGKEKVDAVTAADLDDLHSKLAHTPYRANKMLAIVGSMYTFGTRIGMVPGGFNPTKGIERYREHGKERFLTDDELARIGSAIRLAETEGLPWNTNETRPGAKHLPKNVADRRTKIAASAAAALRLLMFTGARLREILHLRWTEVDLQRGLLLLPDSKTGRKPIFLNTPAIEILENLEQSGEFVIPGDKPDQPRTDLKRPWSAVCKAAGIEGVRLHDLRHTFASYGASSGVGLPTIAALLAHNNVSTTKRYAHVADQAMQRASNMIASQISEAMAREPSEAVVIPFKRAGAS